MFCGLKGCQRPVDFLLGIRKIIILEGNTILSLSKRENRVVYRRIAPNSLQLCVIRFAPCFGFSLGFCWGTSGTFHYGMACTCEFGNERPVSDEGFLW